MCVWIFGIYSLHLMSMYVVSNALHIVLRLLCGYSTTHQGLKTGRTTSCAGLTRQTEMSPALATGRQSTP